MGLTGELFAVVLCHVAPGRYTGKCVDRLRVTSSEGRSNVTCGTCGKNFRHAGRMKTGLTPNCPRSLAFAAGLVKRVELVCMVGLVRTVALPSCLGVTARVTWSGHLLLVVCVYDV